MQQKLNMIYAAFERIKHLQYVYEDSIPWYEIQKGFNFCGEHIHLATKAKGIFKPRQMDGLLSIKTVIPRGTRVPRYNDSLLDDGAYKYALELPKKGKGSNSYLIDAYEQKTPFIYFQAVAPGFYQAIWPCFIRAVDKLQQYVEVIVGESSLSCTSGLPSEIESRYYLTRAKQRGHQAIFRGQVMPVYHYKCALSGLAVPPLLEAAHIIPDSKNGLASITNGIAMSKLHHKAYDSNILGIDGEYRIHLSTEKLNQCSSQLTAISLSELDGKQVWVPKDKSLRPKPEFLESRFKEFSEAQ